MSNNSNGSPNINSIFESLEERVLFDGVPDATFILPQNDGEQLIPAQVQSAQQSDSESPRELILVDAGVENSQQLISEILRSKPDSSLEIRILDADTDGVQQISDILASSENQYDAIHIISHGDEGEVLLGSSKLTANNLDRYADVLSSWSDALTEDADLLFYGCDLAGNLAGVTFVESMAAITGADVAASEDTTGAADQGGDWDLEYTAGVVTAQTLAAYSYTGTLALADATLNIVSSGTPVWDADNNAGNDMNGTNEFIRSHDDIIMEVFYNTDSAGATDLHFTSTLPDGLVWDVLPAAAALDPRSMIVDSVTGLAGGDMRTIIAYLPDVAGTFTSSVNFQARALGGQNGTPLNGVMFEVNANENATPIATEMFDFVLSAAANMDIQLLSPTFRGVFSDATGAKDGAVYSYGIGILGDHPTRTGSDGYKGAAPLENPFTFDIDLSNVTPNAAIFDWGSSLGLTATEYALDGIHRNYERFNLSTGAAATAWSQGNRPGGQIGEHPTSAAWQPDRAVPDSGDWTIIASPSAGVHTVQVSGHDTYGSTFPTNFGSGGVIPAGDKWFSSGQVHIWIPICDIAPGEDGMLGTDDDGVLAVTPQINMFDPDDEWGTTNNFGTGVEDPTNNDYTHTVVSTSLGGGVKRLAEYGTWRWVETSSYWYAGDGETSVGHKYESLLHSGRNGGVLALSGIVFGDNFDNTATKIIPISQYYGGSTYSTSGWGRAYLSGGTTPGFLVEGTDFVVEFGTGGQNGDPAGWSDWRSMAESTFSNADTSTVWTTDPTDIASLGGTADPVTGVSNAITKYRVRLLRDLQPGEVVTTWVSMETFGHSSLNLTDGNPLGDIIADFMAQSADYLIMDTNPDNDWRTYLYDPRTNGWLADGTSASIYRGDRLHIVEADVSVDKTVIDLGAGNNFLAGSAATIQLEGTVTIPGPDSGAPAKDVYITDMLPAGLTVVGGSAQPPAGFTFTAGDGSTIAVQSVEYYDPSTNAWSTTWTYGATGIRWFFGDVPLNTALPTMTFDVLIPFDAMNGESWTNTAVASSPSDDSPEEFRNSSAGLVAVQVAAMSAGKFVVTPLVPEDTTIIYELGIANVSDDKDVPWFDLVDILPYDADFEGSSINGVYTNIDVTSLDPGLEVYVTTASQTTLDSQDGTIDGYADPGTQAAGDAWFVAEGTGIWTYTLADVQAGVAGAPSMGDITAIRVVSDKTIDPYLGPGESTKFFLELDPLGNVGIPSDHYTNKFAARTDPGALPLPVTSAAVTAVVVAPDIEIEKEVALDETHTDIDPLDDSHWGETVSFDDTDKAYFRIKVTNTGTADFLGATVNDSLPAGATLVGGTIAASSGDTTGFPTTWTFNLGAGDTAWLIYQIDVNDAGNYVNEADVEATDAWGETVDDIDDAEANFVTEISAAKQQTGAVRSTTNPALFEVTYEVEVLNSSIFDLANLTLTENLFGAFGPGFMGVMTPPAITSTSLTAGATAPTINGSFNGNSDDQILNGDGLLLTGDSVTITYTVLVDPLLLTDPANTVNQVEAGGLTGGPGGTPTTDLSDDGSDAGSDNPGTRGDDGMGGTDDPTPLVLPAIDLTKQIAGTPTPAASGVNGNFDVTYEFMITNTGTTDLDNISVIEDFLANLGTAFQGIVSGPLVTMTTATDNPDFNPLYDGAGDPNVFTNTPSTTYWTFGGNNTSTTTGQTLVLGDQFFVIDPNQTYMLMTDAYAGDGAGGSYDPSSRNYLGFASYDVDGNVISLYHYAKFASAVDTTLAAPLNPGDTTVTLTDATGWQNAGANHQRSLAWYGYTDGTGYTHPDYTYTRNYLANAWAAGGISGNTITLSTPWAGPALAAGDAVRNTTSGGTYQYSLLSNTHIDQTGGTYATNVGGGYITNGAGGQTLWRPGTHSIRPLILADWGGGGTGTQLNVENFKISAPNMNLLEPGQKVTFQITVEIDPDAPGAIYDGITMDGNNTLENQATVTAEDPWNDIPVSDTSDDPTDPTDAEYGSDSDPDDPTSLAIPSIELTKELVGTPTAASSGTFGNFDAIYEFTITNNGNDDLTMLSLLEDFATQFGGAFISVVDDPGTGAPAVVTASSATDPVEINANYDGSTDTEIFDNTGGNTNLLEMGQTITIQIIVEVDPDAAGANFINGQLLNIAMTAGTGTQSGVTVDDESDDTGQTDDVDPDGDNSPDDPTPLYIPAISLTKAASDAVANGDNWDVTFTKIIKNTGTVTLTNLELLDDIAAQFGNAFVSASNLIVQNFSGTGTAPTANAAWTGDTALDMLNGGTIDMGDSFEVVFTVTIDPDGLDSISQALENTSTVSGDALDEDGNPLEDDMGNPITVSDDSDNGVDPDSENGEDNMDGTPANDPTPIIIADIGVAKQVVSQPTLLSNGNYEATYQLVIENTGTVDLANLSLDDDIAAQFGAQFVDAYGLVITSAPGIDSSITLDSANWDGDGVTEMVNTTVPSLLAVGDSFILQFNVEIDPDAGGTASGPLENQVTAGGTGVDEDGNTYTDSSGDPITAEDLSDDGTDPSTDNMGSPGDHGTSDDPTPVYIPAIGLAKEAGDAVANGDNWDVEFTFVVENTGTVDLNNLNLIDDIAMEFGNAFVSASNLTVQNFVGTGTAPGANSGWETDTMLNMLDGTGQLNVGDSFEVTFTITIDPDGIDSLSQALENQGTITGDALDENGDPIDDGSGGTLQAMDDSDNGTDPNGENGENNGDGTFGNDPTPIIIADVSVAKEVVSTMQLANDNFEAVYQLVIENTGTVHLADMTLIDDLDTQFGAAFVSAGNLVMVGTGPGNPDSNIALDSANWDGDSVIEMLNQSVNNELAVADSFIIQFTVVVDPDATGTSGPLDNQATVEGDAVDEDGNPYTDSNGDPISADDLSDSGDDPSDTNSMGDGDTGGSDDPTPLLLPAMGVGKQANTVTVATDGMGNELTGVFDVQYLVVVENTGTVELTDIQLLDDLTTTSTFGDAYDGMPLSSMTDRSGLVTGPAIVSHTLANPSDLPNLNLGFLGGGVQTNLFDGSSGALQVGEQIVISFTIRIDADELQNGDATDGMAQNQVQGSAESEVGSVTDDSDDGLNPNTDNGEGGTDDPTPFEVPQIRLWKSHSDAVDNGNGTSTITVQLRIQNSGTVDLSNLSLTENLATQFGAAFLSATDPMIVSGPGNPLSSITPSLINSAWNTNTALDVFDSAITNELLKAGDEFTIEFEVTVDPDLIDDDSDYLQNTATVSGDGTNYDGDVIEVSDESGADNGTGIDVDEPTSAVVPEIAIVKTAGDAVANGDNWDVTFTMVVENTGSVNLNNLTLFDDIDAQFGDAYVSVTGLAVQNFAGAGTAPTINSGWMGDTTQTLIMGGDLDPGDRFEVTYTVTIDPDAIDSISQALNNQATVNGDAVDEMGNPLLDENNDPLTADDVSDDGTNPQGTNPGENGDEGTDADPTPIIIADVSIAKEVVGQPTLLSNGNFAATYQMVIENIGTVNLSDMTLVDDIQSQFGAAVFQGVSGLTMITGPGDTASSITLDPTNWDGTAATDMLDQGVTNTLAIGDIFTIQFTVEIDAAAATGVLENQATVSGTGVDENGDAYTDSNGDDITASDDSDDGSETADDNAGSQGDHGTSDDPTPVYLPNIGLAKDAGDAVANGDNFDVTFTLFWENNGNVDLTNLMMFDDIAMQFGNAYDSVTGLAIQNFNGTGTAPTVNAGWMMDTTQSMITGGTAHVGDTFEIVFTVTIDPDGIDDVSQALDNQATTTGDALDENGAPLLDDNGDQITVEDVSDDGVDTNGENGEDDGDGVYGNDPTPIIIADVSVVKSTVGIPVELNDGNFEVTYQLIIENTGTVDLADLTLTEDLAAHFGSVFQSAGNLTLATGPSDPSSSVVLDSTGWDGSGTTEMIDQMAATLLAVGDSFVVTFTVIVDPDAVGAPAMPFENQVTVGGAAVDSSGQPINDSNGMAITTTDESDDGTDPNGDNPNAQGDHGTSDDPTPLLIPDIAVAKTASDAWQSGDQWKVNFRLYVENTGTVSLDNLTLFDDLAAQFGNAFVGIELVQIVNFSGTGTAPGANSGWMTNTALNMLDGTGTLDVGDSFEVIFRVTIDPDGVDNLSQALNNQATVGGNGINPDGTPMDDGMGNPVTTTDDSDNGTDVHGENGEDGGDGVANNDPTPIIIADIGISKEVFGTPVDLGDGTFEITYQVVVENTGTVDLANLSLLEDIAMQFGAPFESAGSLTLVSGPMDATSSIVLDSANWDGSGSTEMIDQLAATLLAVGDSFTIQFNVIVDLDATGTSGPLENQVTATGDAVDEDGNQYTDSSGAPIVAEDDSDSGADPNGDNPGDQGDHGTTDDPTPVLIPDVSLAKSAGAAVANGANWDVEFTFVFENTGTVTLNNLSLVDDIMSEFGNAFVSASGLTVQNLVGSGTLPTANGAWSGNTTLNMLVGGSLDVGSSFEVTFTVTIDPDGIDSVSEALENQGLATGDGVNPDGSQMTDDNGDPVTTTDVSDNGTDPNGENGEDNMDGVPGNDPTPIIIADIALAKSVVGTPSLLSNGNFSVTYQLVVENTGTVDLANLSLLEDLATQLGAGFDNAGGLVITVPPGGLGSTITLDSNWDGSAVTEMVDGGVASLLEVGDSFTLEFTVEVNASAFTSSPTTNTVSTSGDAVDENGDPIYDPSGDPIVAEDDSDSGTDPSTTNTGEPGDTFGSDDPTPLYIPSVGLAKSAGDAVVNGDNWDITFTLVYANNGSVDLHNLTLFDDIATEFGNAFVSASNLTVQNFVGSGTAPTANGAWTGDTSQTMISGGQANVGDTFEIVFTVTIDPDGIDSTSQALNNQATAGGEALDENGNPLTDDSGNPITATDDSDDGSNWDDENGDEVTGDGTYANDPTPILIADIAIAKSIVGDPVLTDLGNYIVTYQLVIENTGTVDLASLSLLEDLSTQFGSAYVDAGNLSIVTPPGNSGSSVTVDSAGWNGSSGIEMMDLSAANLLEVGDSFVLQFDVEIDPKEVTAPLENQATIEGDGVDSNGDPILDSNGDPLVADDLSDSGTEPGSSNPGEPGDEGTSDDPVPFDPPPVPTAEISGTVFIDNNNNGTQDPGEDGIPGVEVTLTGTDVFGNPVEITVLTDANGRYTFDGLNAGNYTLTQAQPDGFTDGIDNGNSAWTIGDDVMSNIELDWGDSFGTSTFGERPTGASGNPPRFPGLPSIYSNPISGLIGSYLGGPGPIYSGIPINANANPLSLDSGRAVMGGYSSGMGLDDGCCDPCGQPDPCSLIEPVIQAVPVMDDCPAEIPMSYGMIMDVPANDETIEVAEEEQVSEDAIVDEEVEAAENETQEIVNPAHVSLRDPSFLSKFVNWLR